MKLFLWIVLLQVVPVTLRRNELGNMLSGISEPNQLGELIYRILERTEAKCVVIFCDTNNYNAFGPIVFSGQSYLSYFMILVKQSEDFVTSTKSIEVIMKTAKNEGCDFYLILLKRGIQASQLLVFGEKYKMFNTRGKFLIFYDYILFHKNYHYLWQRIVNVIFIRKFGTLRPWFEISTVQYPFPIKNIMVPKRIDIWKRSKFRTGADLFKDKTSDLRNQTLKVVTFSHVPATAKIQSSSCNSERTVISTKSNKFVGIEIEILQALSTYLNFTPQLYESFNPDIELWGEKQPDGQYTGLIGEISNNNVDIALGDLHYVQYFLDIMDLSVPYNTECLTFLTPESLTNNSWRTLVLPFRLDLWIAILLSLIVNGFLFRSLSKFHNDLNKVTLRDIKERRIKLKMEIEKEHTIKIDQNINRNAKYSLMKQKYVMPKVEGEPSGLYLFETFGSSLLYTYGMLLVVSLPKLPTGWSIRILTGCYWMYCILIVVAYKASMTAILANPAPRLTVDTLQELVDSRLECGGSGSINVEFFRTSKDPATAIIGERFQKVNDTEDAIDKIAKGSFALYENIYFLKQASIKKRVSYKMQNVSYNGRNVVNKIPKRTHNLHIMSDCVIHMPISIGLQKNSPIKKIVDKIVRRALEAGLIKKWLNDVMQSVDKEEVYFEDNDNIKALMSMQKFFSVIVALLIGYFISFTVLVLEILYFKLVIMKHPNYNKYTKQIIY